MAEPQLPVVDFTAIGPPVGQRLDDIVLPNQRGEMVDLHRARDGRQALVIFYRSAHW